VFWNGQFWKQLLSGTTDNLSAVWGSGPSDLWVAGSGGVRHFNGTAWSPIPGLTSPPIALWDRAAGGMEPWVRVGAPSRQHHG
jgi:hypothetical protein